LFVCLFVVDHVVARAERCDLGHFHFNHIGLEKDESDTNPNANAQTERCAHCDSHADTCADRILLPASDGLSYQFKQREFA
jgi:hypothetical protein